MDKDSEVINHVLSDFDTNEKKNIAEVINKVNEALICLLSEGLTAAMNRYN